MHIKKIYRNEANASLKATPGTYPSAPVANASKDEWDRYVAQVLAVKDGGTGTWKVLDSDMEEYVQGYNNYAHALATIRTGVPDATIRDSSEYFVEAIADIMKHGASEAFRHTIAHSDMVEAAVAPDGESWGPQW